MVQPPVLAPTPVLVDPRPLRGGRRQRRGGLLLPNDARYEQLTRTCICLPHPRSNSELALQLSVFILVLRALCSDCDEFKYDCYQYEQSQWTFIISITSAVCTAIGFALLIIGCSIWNIRDIRFETEFVTLMLTFMSVGLVGSLFVYTRYAVKEATAGFWVSSFVNIAYLYALTLLYSVCAYARVVALPRAFLLCFTFAVTFTNAVAIMANEFSLGVCYLPNLFRLELNCTDGANWPVNSIPAHASLAVLFLSVFSKTGSLVHGKVRTLHKVCTTHLALV